MGSTNKTAHYELPQFVANDKPSWLGDVNQAMEAIDTGIFGAKSSADGAQTTANNAVAGVQTANTRMDGMQTQLDTVATQANQTATAVNQHTASIATNSANINTLNSRMGNTDISDIGDGTVTGAIQAISEGGGGGASNVRWNATTDRFEVLKNGNWVQSIRAFVNSLAVFVSGVFGINMENGVYGSNSSVSSAQIETFRTEANVLVADFATNSHQATLVSDNPIDFNQYSTVKVNTTEYGNLSLNVSSYSGSGYLWIMWYRSVNGSTAVNFGVSTSKTAFDTNTISGLVERTAESGTIGAVHISEITIE